MDGVDLAPKMRVNIRNWISSNVSLYLASDDRTQWDMDGFTKEFFPIILKGEDIEDIKNSAGMTREDVESMLISRAEEIYEEKEKLMTPQIMREAERVILLRNVDSKWMDHIDAMDALENSIRLQAYGQRDPIAVYKIEGLQMYNEMNEDIIADTVRQLLSVMPRKEIKRENVVKITGESHGGEANSEKRAPVKKTAAEKVGRNDPCPCGSGLKYKKCCGAGKSGGNE